MKPHPPLQIRLDRLQLSQPPPGGEARLRSDIARELTRLLADDTAGPRQPSSSLARQIAQSIRRSLPAGREPHPPASR